MTDNQTTPACGICAMIDRIKAHNFRDFIAELNSCYVILGDQQFYRGYCVLFAKIHATELYLMPADAARELFEEMRRATKTTNSGLAPFGCVLKPNEKYRLTKMTAARSWHPSASNSRSASLMRASRRRKKSALA